LYFSEEKYSLSGESSDNGMAFDTDTSLASGIFLRRGHNKTSDWSVPWSDLMMTMFVLFAVLYAYSALKKEVPEPLKKPEIIFKEVPKPVIKEDISQFYEKSMETIRAEKLEDITSVELIKDKAVKIILPSDVFFDIGKAELKSEAVGSLRAVGELIKETNYTVTVAGHTDAIPINTEMFPSNWELSTARACVAAKFIIEQANIPPGQIQVIGYAEFRPVATNETPEGRTANRRVEVIISKDDISDSKTSS
jgi:chemotaxis protein MotB